MANEKSLIKYMERWTWEKHWDRPSWMGSVCTYIVFFVHFQQKVSSKEASQPERQEHPQHYVNQPLFRLAWLTDVQNGHGSKDDSCIQLQTYGSPLSKEACLLSILCAWIFSNQSEQCTPTKGTLPGEWSVRVLEADSLHSISFVMKFVFKG